jgi:hypothetical protein
VSAETAGARRPAAVRAIAALAAEGTALGFCTDCGTHCLGRIVGDIEQNCGSRTMVICAPCDRALRERHRAYARTDLRTPSGTR